MSILTPAPGIGLEPIAGVFSRWALDGRAKHRCRRWPVPAPAPAAPSNQPPVPSGTIVAIFPPQPSGLLRRGFALEYTTLVWNVVGVAVLAWSAIRARSVALAGFGLDSLIEIGASVVVVWELNGADKARQRGALRLIGGAFALLALYLVVQRAVVLATGHRPPTASPASSGRRLRRRECSSWPRARLAPGRPWATSCSALRPG